MFEKYSIGTSSIKSLFVELAQIGDMLNDRSVAMDNAEYLEAMERHWNLREQIAAAPVQSLDDLAWLAHAARLEAERDPEFTNDAPGSARALARALADGARQFAGAAQRNTSFMLLAQYERRAIVPLDLVCADYFAHLTPQKLAGKIDRGEVKLRSSASNPSRNRREASI
jgi:hypothetical protein